MDMGWKRTDELPDEMLLPAIKLEMESTSCASHWFLSSRLLGPLEDFGLLQRRDLPKQEAFPGIDEVRKTQLFGRFMSFDLG